MRVGSAHGELPQLPVASLAHLARVGDLLWLLILRTEVRIFLAAMTSAERKSHSRIVRGQIGQRAGR